MNAVIPYMVLGLVLTGCPSALAGERAAAGSLAGGSSLVGYVPNEFIVVLAESVSPLQQRPGPSGRVLTGLSSMDRLGEQFGVTGVARQFAVRASEAGRGANERRLSRHYKVRFSRGQLGEAMRAYRTEPSIEHVEPIGVHRVYLTPNDTYYDDPPSSFPYDQWHYWANYGVVAPQAWDRETGDPDVIVAVLDTGVKYTHTDLGGTNPPGPADNNTQGNVWVNAAETPGDGVDNDGNGYVDDVVGWDFVAQTGGPGIVCLDADCGEADNDPADGEGHGTHIAGTIAAITNNGYSVSGIAGGFANGSLYGAANGCRVMCLRIGYRAKVTGNETALVRMDAAAEGLYYVGAMAARGERVTAVNCSWGSSNTGGLDAAVDYVLGQDVMVIHAAGNDAGSTADYLGAKAGVVNVAATGATGAGASFTNYGSWVDIAAPGVDIMSTFHDPDDPDPSAMYMGLLSGTSMAAPHVCGVAALLESYYPALSGPEKLAVMTATASAYADGRDLGAGIVNAAAALEAVSPPAAVAAISADAGASCGQVVLTWTAVTGATGYVVDYQEAAAGPPYVPAQDGLPASGSDVGNVTGATVGGLDPLTPYYFAVRAYNAYGMSDYSAASSATANTGCHVTVSGHVRTFDGHGIGGVLLEADPGGVSALSELDGSYILHVPLGWGGGAVEANKEGWWFEPTERAYLAAVMNNLTEQDFVGFRRADFDGDGDTDLSDVARLADWWLADDCGEPDWCAGVDMNLDGAVEATDMGLLLEQWFGSD